MDRITSSLKLGFSWFGLIVATIASISVVANNAYFLNDYSLTINSIFLLISALLGLMFAMGSLKGLAGLIFLLPLSACMHQQINAYFGISLMALPNAGLDLVAGFFIVYLVVTLLQGNFSSNRWVFPWPLGLLLFYISLSTALAIIRNIRQSATETSVYGLFFNLSHFRPIGWHDDYMPITDWIAYGCAGAIVFVVIQSLRGVENKSQTVFHPLIASLVIACLMGLLQASTGLGLSESMLTFRKDNLGFAAIGFQPDIHAFAGHMLLGAVGLWAYFLICRNRLERGLVLIAIAFSWLGLIISKSRASLLIAIIMIVVIALIYVWNKNRKWFYRVCICSALIISTFVFFLALNAESPIQLLTNQSPANWWSVIGGASGSRFEIWSGAFNMIKAFPLVGVGQGNFYHLSADLAFSKSHFLALNGGENSHNYFFQTFAELGLVGILLFVLAFILPIINAPHSKTLLPAALGIIALFLGNIYAHSFLVRENLLICATLLGLLYALAWSDASSSLLKLNLCFAKNKRSQLLGLVACLLLASASLYEIYQSFYTKIFDIGVNCFQPRPLTEDRWTSGVYEVEIPPSGKKLEILAQRPQTGRHPKDIRIRFDEPGNHDPSALTPYIATMQDGKEKALIFTLSQSIENFPHSRKVIMRVENCFTPRNFGINTDGRILGIQINEQKILY